MHPFFACLPTVPLYHPAMVWQQLMHEERSRLDACAHKVRRGRRRVWSGTSRGTSRLREPGLCVQWMAGGGIPGTPEKAPGWHPVPKPGAPPAAWHAGPSPGPHALHARHAHRPLPARLALAQVWPVVHAQPQVSAAAAAGAVGPALGPCGRLGTNLAPPATGA